MLKRRNRCRGNVDVNSTVHQPNEASASPNDDPMGDGDSDAQRGVESLKSASALQGIVRSPTAADVVMLDDVMEEDVAEQRSVESSKFSSALQSVDMSQNTPDIVMHDILSDNSNQGSHGNHQAREVERSQTQQVSQHAAGNTEGVNTTPTQNFNRNHDTATINSDLDTLTAEIGTVSNSNTSTIGTFTVSNGSRNTGSIVNTGNCVEAKQKHSRSEDTFHSSEPPAQKGRSTLRNAPNIKSESAGASFAPDSPVVVDEMSLVANALAFKNEDVQAKHDTSNDLEKYVQPDCKHHESPDSKMRAIPRAKLTFNFEIAVKPGDMSTSTGLGNVSGASVQKLLSELSNCYLDVGRIKEVLDELSILAINEVRQLRGRGSLDRAARVISNAMKSHLEDKNVQLKAFNFVGQLCDNLGYAPVANDFFKQTMEVLQRHHRDSDMFYHGLRMLRVLYCRDIGARNLTSKATGIELLVHPTSQQPSQHDIGLGLLNAMKNHDVSKKTTGIDFLINGIRQHSSHGGIQGEGCHLLGRLASNYEKAVDTIVDSNGIDSVLKAMKQHNQVEDIQAFGCYALAAFGANHRVYQRAVVDMKGSKAIEQALQHYPANAEVKKFGAQLLRWFQEIGKFYWISLEKMRRESSKSSLKIHECKLLLDELSDLAINDDRQLWEPDTADQAVGVVSNIIQRHVNDTQVASKVLKCLDNLRSNFTRHSIVIPADITAHVITVLQLYHEDSDICYHGLLLLRTLIYCDYHAAAEAYRIFELVLYGMRHHSNHAGIQKEGCGLLERWARDHRANRDAIANSNGIGLVLQAMQRHDQVENVQESGCRVLYELSKDHKANQQAMIKTNTIKVVQNAVRVIPKNSGVKMDGGRVLKCLQALEMLLKLLEAFSMKVDDIKLVLEELLLSEIDQRIPEFVGAIINVMERHQNEKDVLAKAFIFARHLCDRNKLYDFSRLVQHTLNGLQLHHNDTNLVHHGLSLLLVLIGCAVNAKETIVEANGIDLVLSGMHHHANHAGIQKEGCAILGLLACGDSENQGTIAAANGSTVILQAMQRHEQDENFQGGGCCALYSLAKDHKMNQRAMIEEDGVKIIQQAVRRFPMERNVKFWGRGLLKRLQERERLDDATRNED